MWRRVQHRGRWQSALHCVQQRDLLGAGPRIPIVEPQYDVVLADAHAIIPIHQPAVEECRRGDAPRPTPRLEQPLDVTDVDRDAPAFP
jgi:hypothetical protein